MVSSNSNDGSDWAVSNHERENISEKIYKLPVEGVLVVKGLWQLCHVTTKGDLTLRNYNLIPASYNVDIISDSEENPVVLLSLADRPRVLNFRPGRRETEAAETSQKAKLACFTVYFDWHVVKKLLYVQSPMAPLCSVTDNNQTWPLVRGEKVDGSSYIAIWWCLAFRLTWPRTLIEPDQIFKARHGGLR